MPVNTSKTLTDNLISLRTIPRPYSAATQHAFLSAAGSGSLTDLSLSLWLSQDRIYAAHAYPRFIGLLISKIPFVSSHSLDSAEEQRNQRILKLLVYSLDNIVREAAFFKETSKKWGLDIERWSERKATRDYTAEMARVASLESLESGLVFLWAMERVYLDAWKHVASLLQQSKLDDTRSAVPSLVSNWTSQEFEEFVNKISSLVNDLGIQPDSDGWKKAEGIWSRVVELEETFWPEEGEEHWGSSLK